MPKCFRKAVFFFVVSGLGASAALAGLAWGPFPLYVANNLPSGKKDNERYSRAVSDGAGGTFMVWVASDMLEDTPLQVYGQHLGPKGEKLWNRGDPLLLASNPDKDLWNLWLVNDGKGGVLVAYSTLENDPSTGSRSGPLFIQRFDREGRSIWASPTRAAGGADNYLLLADGEGGATSLASAKGRESDSVFVFRVDASGRLVYNKKLYDTPTAPPVFWADLGISGVAKSGEALFVIADSHLSKRFAEIFSIHVSRVGAYRVNRLSSGYPAGMNESWPCARYLTAAADGAGGAYVVWAGWHDGGQSLHLARVDGRGRLKPSWGARAVSIDGDPASYKFNLFSKVDGEGGLLLQYAARPAGPFKNGCSGPECSAPAGRRHPVCNEAARFVSAGSETESSASLWLARFSPGKVAAAEFALAVAASITQDQHDMLANGGAFYSSWVDYATRDVLARRIDRNGAASGPGVVLGSYKGEGSLGITAMPESGGGVVVAWKQEGNLYVQAITPGSVSPPTGSRTVP
ncbi:MAG: hypothetical protein HY921_02630 [Elusimicrobia bacterium]|nr:hypothetical protein [Elusimicrobiota bacterium]